MAGSGEFVFLNSKGKPYKSADSMKNAFKNLCKRAKIERFWFHDLRRTSATNMYEEEPNMKMVSLVLGHSDTRVTERYVQPPDKSLRDFVERIASKNKYD